MKLVVGLGNPGEAYANTRHNIGFVVIDALADACSAPAFGKKFRSLASNGTQGTEKFLLLKPQTYMNVSGEAVQEAAAYYRIAPPQIIVVHDEMDLPFGQIRVKIGGGNAGHNGLASLTQMLGTNDYVRLRFGIGRSAVIPARDYVLGRFSSEENEALPAMITRAVAAVLDIGKDGPQKAMNIYNRTTGE